MSAFYVGQRVRVVQAATSLGAPFVGREALVIERREFFFTEGYGLDVLPITLSPVSGMAIAWGAHQLEPIIPPGLESTEEINALYEPAPVGVLA